jgi:hypothetical protein
MMILMPRVYVSIGYEEMMIPYTIDTHTLGMSILYEEVMMTFVNFSVHCLSNCSLVNSTKYVGLY